MEFLAEPRPDTITRLADRLKLTAGVTEVTETVDGLKVVPHKAIGIALGDDRAIDLAPTMARAWAHRIIEMCDFITSRA